MRILALNCGSSSVKYRLFETAADQPIASGIIDRIGGHYANHEDALAHILASLPDHAEIRGVGHRIVHGGDRFRESVVLDGNVAEIIASFNYLAPLHNPANLAGYRAARHLLPHATQVAVFDTAFFHSLPPEAYTYALPLELAAKYKIRRYGFHGTSHRYVSQRAAELMNKPAAELKLITIHLGNGCSAAAVEGGAPIDTSLGLTPLEGLVMGTRSGDIDPAIAFLLMSWENLTPAGLDILLNKQSGLLGLSGISNDMRTVEEAADRGDERARLALGVFCHRLRKYIGAYYAALNGAAAIVFTGGIGENSAPIRAMACRKMEALGISIDHAKNAACKGVEADIAADGAPTRVWVVPTNEELLIARDTERLVQSL